MMKIFVTQPYCPSCAKFRPAGRTESFCIPCLNVGHTYRLVTDEKDRLERVTLWASHYSTFGFTNKEIKAIPHFRNLLGHTFSRIRIRKQEAST